MLLRIAIRALGGTPDLDPTSDHVLNQWIGAHRYLTAEQDATKQPWFPGAPAPLRARLGPKATPEHRPETVLCNPPGGLVKELWYSLCSYWELGWISSAVWVGFSLEQLAYLQRTRALFHPLQLPTLLPTRRIAYRTPSGDIAASPPHGSYLTLLTLSQETHHRFVTAARPMGHVINA